MTAALRFENVTKRFVLQHDRPRSFKEAFVGLLGGSRRTPERLVALDEVSFQLEHGGALGLVGPNGTGKSTALKLAARILEPTEGRVLVSGRVAALLELGAGFHPDLSGRENIYLNGSLMGLTRGEMERRMDEIVAFAELERFIDMPVKHYSSGMYMRLGFATAIHVEPDIILVDEVLAVGDQAFQAKCLDRITELRKAGVTICLVSHDIGAVRRICERALWLEEGRSLAYGPVDQVLEAYYASIMSREEERFAAEHRTARAPGTTEVDRWGSGEVEIIDVEVLGPDDTVQHVLVTGGPLTLRVRYHARQRVEQPVFGLAIHRDDGVHVAGPNTLDAGLDIPAIEGEGELRYHLDAVPLLSGTYELSVSCYDRACSHPFDYHHRRFPIHVRSDTARPQYGLLRFDAEWRHSADSESSRSPADSDQTRRT